MGNLITVARVLLLFITIGFVYLGWSQNGQQGGDPAKLAKALITIASEAVPPRRFIAGADSIATAEQKVAQLHAQIDAYRALSSSLAFDDAK